MPDSSAAPGPDEPARLEGTRELPPGVDVEALLDQLPAILYVAEPGSQGRWHYISDGVEEILGFSPAEWKTDPDLWARQIDPRDRERVLSREDALAEPDAPDEYRMRHREGAIVWVRDEAVLLPDARGRLRWHGVISDITDRKLAESMLERRAEQQAAVALLGKHALEGEALASLLDEALAAVLRVDGVEAAAVLEHLGDGTSLSVRAQRGSWPGGPLEPLEREQPGRSRGAPSSRSPSHPPAPDRRTRTEVRIESAGGRWGELWLAHPQRLPGPSDVNFAQALANTLAGAIARRAAEERVRYQAGHDPLTGLPNRALFLDRLGEALDGPGGKPAVMLLDIDNFKLINDSLGHAAGDELLMQVAPRLRAVLRPGDVIARLGGDEFVMLLAGVGDERSATELAERIIAVFEPPFTLDRREHFAKASLGIALDGRSGSTPVSLLRDADAALYEAKKRGRARFEVFDHVMRTRTIDRLAIETDLRRALEREQLHVDYQPVVSLRDGSIRSVEALLRWHHPERGEIPPAEFIPVAEESGMIEEIGRWVLHAACSQGTRWQSSRPGSAPLGVAVNLSARQFMQRGLEATVAQVLASTGLDPSALSLEITESVLLEDPVEVGRTIERMARLGVRFVLDDFGTGYSSLAYLGGLAIDGLKVDRSFVAALGVDARSTAITTAVVRMAHALSLEVVAEGVEAERQASVLHELGCELAQGFLFHRPLDPETVSALLAGDSSTPPRPAHPRHGRRGAPAHPSRRPSHRVGG